jgi:hypothetical protein
MNRKQWLAVQIGLMVILLMALFPPWLGRYYTKPVPLLYTTSLGYGFVLWSPTEVTLRGASIDLPLLVAQWMVVIAAVALLISFLRNTEKGSSKEA